MRRASGPRGRAWYVSYGVCLVFVVPFLASVVLWQAVDVGVSNLNSVPSVSTVDEDDFRRTCLQSLLLTALLIEVAAEKTGSERVNAVPPAPVVLSHDCRTAIARAVLGDTAPPPTALA